MATAKKQDLTVAALDIHALINEALNNAVKPNIDDFTKSFDNTDGTKIYVSQKVYDLPVAKGKTTTLTVNDPALISAIESYKSADKVSSLAMYVKCKALSNMANCGKTLIDMGFKTVGKFANHVLGIAENTANQYARIGKYFIGDNFLPLECFPANMEVTKMLEFLPFVIHEGTFDPMEVLTLYASGVIVDGMSQKKLREALKEQYKALPATATATNATDATATDATATATDATDATATAKGNKKPKNVETYRDAIKDMSNVEAASTLLSVMDIARAIISKYADKGIFDPNVKLGNVESICDVARLIVELKDETTATDATDATDATATDNR